MSLLMRRRALLSAIDKVKNLFHIEKVSVYGSGFTFKKENNSLIYETKSTNNLYLTFNSACIDLKPNTKYTCRAIVTEINNGSVNGAHIAGTMQRCLKLQTKYMTYDTKSIYIVNGYTGGYTGAESEIITKFTTPADLSEYKYVATRMADNMTVIFKDIVIVEGDTIPDSLIPKDPVSPTISFSIEGEMNEAGEGMTWAEWVESKYNTKGYIINDFGNVTKADMGGVVCYTDATDVSQLETIISEYAYGWLHAGGSN